MDIVDFAEKIATEAHAGQFRSDGKPYISHPAAVVQILKNDFPCDNGDYDIMLAVGWLHDVPEDNPKYNWPYLESMFKGFNSSVVYRILSILNYLNHEKADDYPTYIFKMRNNKIAIKVKLADLEHNLSDHPPGGRRDKYMLAKMYLNEMLEK